MANAKGEIQLKDFLPFAITYGLMVFFCILVSMEGFTPFVAVAAVTIVATMELCALFSVLGPGPYWKRSLASLAVGGTIAFCGVFAMGIVSLTGFSRVWINAKDFPANDCCLGCGRNDLLELCANSAHDHAFPRGGGISVENRFKCPLESETSSLLPRTWQSHSV